MKWNTDNEIYETDPDFSRRSYGTRKYNPDWINKMHNQGETGAYYPEHEYYKKGQKRYLIVWGKTQKNDLPHEFRSSATGNDQDLANKAKMQNLGTYKPTDYVWLSDMHYEKKDGSIGWTYTRRTEELKVSADLRSRENDSAEVELIPLNTRYESDYYKFNKSTLPWKLAQQTIQSGQKVKLATGEVITLDDSASVIRNVHDQKIETLKW